MVRRAIVVVVALTSALLPACDGGSGEALEGPRRRLVSYSEGGSQQPVPDSVEATATFADGIVQGESGCNSFSGGYELSGDSLTFGPLASTMMACEQPQSDVEAAVLAGLEATATFRVEEGRLVLLDEAGSQLLVYEESAV